MFKLLFLLISTALLVFHFNDQLFFNSDVNPIQRRLGNPFGKPLLLNSGNKYKDYKITALASYDINAKVVSKAEYLDDEASEFSNYDFALGWNKLIKDEFLKSIEITQGDRHVYFKNDGTSLISGQEVQEMISNTHIIAGNDRVAQIVPQVKKGDFVSMKGYLVNIEGKGKRWRTSLSRDDSGDGACEIMWVDNITINST